MGITYKHENGGYKHIIEINETWNFKNKKDFDDCSKFLIDNEIQHTFSKFVETWDITIKTRWIKNTKDDRSIEATDEQVKDMLLMLFYWKCKGVRQYNYSSCE